MRLAWLGLLPWFVSCAASTGVQATTTGPEYRWLGHRRFAQAQPFGGYLLKLLELRPAPVSGQTGREYSALLHLEAGK